MEYLFVITNGSGYISYDDTQKPRVVTKKELAKRFTKIKAENFLKNLNGAMKNLGYYMEPDEESNEFIEQAVNKANGEINNILIKVQEFEEYVRGLCKKRDALTFEMSKIDSEIEDILHAAEFYNLNACEGYKLYKMLRDCRIRRRKIKDYIEVVGYIENATGKDFSNGIGSKSIINKTTREYAPRVLNELFNR